MGPLSCTLTVLVVQRGFKELVPNFAIREASNNEQRLLTTPEPKGMWAGTENSRICGRGCTVQGAQDLNQDLRSQAQLPLPRSW